MGSEKYASLPVHDVDAAATTPATPAPKKRCHPAFKVGIPVFILFVLLGQLGTGFPGCAGKKGSGMRGGMGGMGMMNGTRHGMMSQSHMDALSASACPKQPAPRAIGEQWNPADDAEYATMAADRLSAAVQIHTVSFDDMPEDPKDGRFDGHYEFAEWMSRAFPKVYETLDHEMVNTHGHLFTWKGSSENKGKPVMLMAHIDTVPVNPDTVDQWTHAPWSGAVTTDETKATPGTWIWGRGASDCKNSIVGILGAAEKLIEEGFTPERDVLIAYGFDEEIGGGRGAMPIADVIEERYGADGVAFIIDEGFSGIQDLYGVRIATLGMAEKGSVSVTIKVDTPGGHSSMPPVHTGIGLVSRLLTILEDHPFKPTINEDSPYLKFLSCLAEYAPEFPKKIAKRLKHPHGWPKLAKDLASKDRMVNSFLATSTAVDLIHGGVKVNALPETVVATVNHRIEFTSSVNETLQHYIDLMVPAVKKLDLTATFFGEDYGKKSDKHVTFSVIGTEHPRGLEPAPITPSDSEAFAFIGGTIRAVFGDKTIITPTGMFANTDTARTWALTKHIYRFTPAQLTDAVNVHTVDERVSLRAHLSTTQFYHRLLRNLEGWEGEQEEKEE